LHMIHLGLVLKHDLTKSLFELLKSQLFFPNLFFND